MDKLPNGWKIFMYDDLKVNNDIGLVRNTNEQGENKKYKYIKMNNISIDGKLNFDKLTYVDVTKNDLERFSLKKNDFLFNTRNSKELVGKTCLFELDEQDIVFNNNILRTRFNHNTNPQFVNYQFKSEFIQKQLESIKSGTTNVCAIYYKNLKDITIILPPLPEQTRIVNKLDSLFERIDKSIALLEENIKHTEALMASVLDEIFSKINAKRFQVKDLSKNIQYGYTGKALDKGEYYYLRITDIQNGKVNFSNTPYSDIPESQVDKYVLKHGDILFARTGATAGKSYLFNDDEKSVFASYLIRVVCNEKVLIPNYLYCFFQSKGYWDQIFGNIVGAAQPNFNGKKLGEIIVPLPDINTQQKIIEKFESLTKSFEQITIQQQSKLSYLKALKASLLDKAFKGEL